MQSVERLIGCFRQATDFGLVEVYGDDAERYLQAQTSNDVAALGPCLGQQTTLLDRKAHVIAFFDIFRHHKSFRIIVEKRQMKVLFDHLDQFRFKDKVEFLDLSDGGCFYMVQGAKASKLIASGLSGKHKNADLSLSLFDTTLFGVPAHIFKKSITGDEGYFVWLSTKEKERFDSLFSHECRELGMIPATEERLNMLRIEAGTPVFGSDFTCENLLSEAALDEHVVSYTKGCFPGQEVLARVRAQGAPTKGLSGIVFEATEKLQFPRDCKVMLGEVELAVLKSTCYSEALEKTISISMVKREYRVPHSKFNVTIEGKPYKIEVVQLPFYQRPSGEVGARALYDKALKLYANHAGEPNIIDGDCEDPIKLLEQAIQIDPKFEDAYEMLGVILSKRQNLDEAISLMHKLAQINAESVMAHANLSVFYMELGMKERAEEEKALSMSIRMQLLARESMKEQADKEAAEKKKEETTQRLNMFKEVLAIDGDDLLANAGAGSCHVALGQFQEAVPFLEKAIAIKSTHTVAYIELGKAYEGLDERDKASTIYRKGIEVAAKRGDMTPLKDMEIALTRLSSTNPKGH